MAYPGTIGPTGLSIPSLPDLVAFLQAGMLSIYPNANLNPNSPDGQWIDLFAQAAEDNYQLLQGVYATWDPSQATGVNLDRCCAYVGIKREEGTYTQQSIEVTNSAAVTLAGLDATDSPPFTVADGQGNQYELLYTTVLGSPGITSLAFEAVVLGPVQSAANSINVPVTIIPGVTAVNNVVGPTVVGTNEESDPALRIRFANSTALPSRGYLQGLYGALLDVDGVAFARVLENTGSSVDANGVPGHSIWCVVDITASDVGTVEEGVANAIYVKRNAGCGLKGGITVPITQVDGSTFDVLFDESIQQNLWVEAQVVAITGTVDLSYIAAQVLNQFGQSYGIGQAADASSIVAYIKEIAPNASVSAEGVSTTGSGYTSLVTPTGVNYQFEIAGSSYVSITS